MSGFEYRLELQAVAASHGRVVNVPEVPSGDFITEMMDGHQRLCLDNILLAARAAGRAQIAAAHLQGDSKQLGERLSTLLNEYAWPDERFAVLCKRLGQDRLRFDITLVELEVEHKEEARDPPAADMSATAPIESSGDYDVITPEMEEVLCKSFHDFARPWRNRSNWVRLANSMSNSPLPFAPGGPYLWQLCEQDPVLYDAKKLGRHPKNFGRASQRLLEEMLTAHDLKAGMRFSPEDRARFVAKTGDYKRRD